jgi:hypothetical protein
VYSTASSSFLGPTQPPIQRILRSLSLGIKRQEREADHSSPSGAEVEWGGMPVVATPLSSVITAQLFRLEGDAGMEMAGDDALSSLHQACRLIPFNYAIIKE